MQAQQGSKMEAQSREIEAYLLERSTSEEDPRKEKEEKFYELIFNTTHHFVKGGIPEDDLKEIIEAFKYDTGKNYRDTDFSKENNRLAHFFRYGPVSAGVADFMISRALEEATPETVLPFLQSEEIKIVDLGAGHGCGTVGLCSAFNAYFRGKRVELTLVDWVKEWADIFREMERRFREENFGNVSEFFHGNAVNTTYEWADLKHPEENENYRKSLNEADIILLSRVLTIVKLREIDNIATKIVKEMKKGAVLIFIDCIENYYQVACPEPFNELEKIYSINDENEKDEDEDEKIYRFIGAIWESDFRVSKTTLAKIHVFKKK